METIVSNLRESIKSISHHEDKLKILIENMKDRKIVLLGEASHGTHEYYKIRRDISKRLITEHGFQFIAVEGDWPSCFLINEYIKGRFSAPSTSEVLCRSFERWPRWMWANEDIEELIEWIKEFNKNKPEEEKVGFYGLDVYSLWESLDVLIKYFEGNQVIADQIYNIYNCFEPYHRDEQQYAYATHFIGSTCEHLVSKLVERLTRERLFSESELDLSKRINALVIQNAEHYYRSMIQSNDNSWNIRDHHMNNVLSELCNHFYDKKVIVWEHNTHIGDARATTMSIDGTVNLGQLVRERYGRENVYITGFGSYTGHVLAARKWGSNHENLLVPQAKLGSWESILHTYGIGDDFLMIFDNKSRANTELTKWRGHRAIGVVYQPEYESGNYVPSNLPDRYDAFWFVDTATSLKPLGSGGELGELETYPSGV